MTIFKRKTSTISWKYFTALPSPPHDCNNSSSLIVVRLFSYFIYFSWPPCYLQMRYLRFSERLRNLLRASQQVMRRGPAVQAWALSLPFWPGEVEIRLLPPTHCPIPRPLHRPQAASSPSPPPFPVAQWLGARSLGRKPSGRALVRKAREAGFLAALQSLPSEDEPPGLNLYHWPSLDLERGFTIFRKS